MAARGYLDAQAIQHLERMWSDAPWIWAPSTGGVQTVRHNLNTPLAEQLLAFVADEPVTNMVVHAPFYDPACEALRRLLTSPQTGTRNGARARAPHLGRPSALAHVLETCGARTDILLAATPGFPGTYLHAKFILIRTQARSVNFLGSANLSLAALYRTDRAGRQLAAGQHRARQPTGWSTPALRRLPRRARSHRANLPATGAQRPLSP